jgi:hypothetical protein
VRQICETTFAHVAGEFRAKRVFRPLDVSGTSRGIYHASMCA